MLLGGLRLGTLFAQSQPSHQPGKWLNILVYNLYIMLYTLILYIIILISCGFMHKIIMQYLISMVSPVW